MRSVVGGRCWLAIAAGVEPFNVVNRLGEVRELVEAFDETYGKG